jgi:putative ATP-binding cassette transporter
VILVRLTMDASKDIRIRLYRRILKSPLDKLENVGHSRVISSITVDIERIIEGAEVFPNLFVSAITLVSMMAVLFFINENIFYLVMGSILFGGISFIVLNVVGNYFFAEARNKVEGLYENIENTVYGIKELKLCKTRRERFLEEVLIETERNVLEVSKKGATILSVAINYGNVIGYFFIGAVTFIFVNYYSISQIELFGIIMILIYIIEPIGVLLETVPALSLANISINKINKLFSDLPEEHAGESNAFNESWSTLSLNGVCYEYEALDSQFRVGPVDLSFEKGTVNFIVGGNGSGKSTLCKLITSHYGLVSGHIDVDGVKLSEGNLNNYRNMISAIFSDYYLFDRLFIEELESKRDVVGMYLKKLELNHVVSIDDGYFSTRDLSSGQRKRLALLTSILEDKDIYIFDEWAADQDPLFKELFYREIIPELKEMNKLLIVITHDDRYFDYADRVLMIENGNIKN